MKNFVNLDSTAVDAISVTGTDVAITYKGSNKTYNYVTNDENFAVSLENVIENNQSVGRYINKLIREDQTLQIVAV
jgi:hypothetical protein